MPSRSFTAKHKLQDAEDELALAIYRFREAERLMSSDYDTARCEMNRAHLKVATIRQHIYSGNIYSGTSEKLFMETAPSRHFNRCPVPAWI